MTTPRDVRYPEYFDYPGRKKYYEQLRELARNNAPDLEAQKALAAEYATSMTGLRSPEDISDYNRVLDKTDSDLIRLRQTSAPDRLADEMAAWWPV